jgi:23S rRNA (cytosine1962-C5)-methyltransferase
MQTIHLKAGRERSLERRHPWLFDGAIERLEGDPSDGLAVVRSKKGAWLGAGVVSPRAPLRGRIVRFDGEPLDERWIAARVDDALALRDRFVPPDTTAFRAIHSEGDLVPGIVVDRYGETLVVQCGTAGGEAILPWALAPLRARFSPSRIVFRRDLPQRQNEGLSTESVVEGEPIPEEGIEILERGLRFRVDPWKGQKTGFFLDQRENRQRVRELAAGRRLLNVCCYTGGFGVAAAAGGATSTTNLDVSAPALELARDNFRRNALPLDDDGLVAADAFDWLRGAKQGRKIWDMVVLDPPAFVKSKGALDRGLRGYKDLNLQAMPLVAPGGLLFTFSCSGLVDLDLFQKVVFGASADAGVRFRLIERLGAGPDHPVLLDCPETEYLKGLLLERVG